MVFMVSSTHQKLTKDILFNFGGTLSQWEKLEDGSITTLEYQVQYH